MIQAGLAGGARKVSEPGAVLVQCLQQVRGCVPVAQGGERSGTLFALDMVAGDPRHQHVGVGQHVIVGDLGWGVVEEFAEKRRAELERMTSDKRIDCYPTRETPSRAYYRGRGCFGKQFEAEKNEGEGKEEEDEEEEEAGKIH